MDIQEMSLTLQRVLREIAQLKREDQKNKCWLSALEADKMEQQDEITNIQKRIQNDFPVAPWDE